MNNGLMDSLNYESMSLRINIKQMNKSLKRIGNNIGSLGLSIKRRRFDCENG